MKIFTNKGYLRELDKCRNEFEHEMCERQARDDLYGKFYRLEERVSALEGRNTLASEPVETRKRKR